jgi:hypothetical protein
VSARAGAVARWWGTVFVDRRASGACEHRDGHETKAEAVECGKAMLAAMAKRPGERDGTDAGDWLADYQCNRGLCDHAWHRHRFRGGHA